MARDLWAPRLVVDGGGGLGLRLKRDRAAKKSVVFSPASGMDSVFGVVVVVACY